MFMSCLDDVRLIMECLPFRRSIFVAVSALQNLWSPWGRPLVANILCETAFTVPDCWHIDRIFPLFHFARASPEQDSCPSFSGKARARKAARPLVDILLLRKSFERGSCQDVSNMVHNKIDSDRKGCFVFSQFRYPKAALICFRCKVDLGVPLVPGTEDSHMWLGMLHLGVFLFLHPETGNLSIRQS